MNTRVKKSQSHGRWQTILDITLAVAFLMATGWLTDFFRGEPFVLFANLPQPCAWASSVLLAGVFTAITATWLYKRRLNFLPVRHLGSQKNVVPHKVLIACLSSNDCKVRMEDEKLVVTKANRDPELVERNLSEATNPDRLRGWNWQQLLRAVEPHVESKQLRHIFLVCSPKSYQQVNDCKLTLNFFCVTTLRCMCTIAR